MKSFFGIPINSLMIRVYFLSLIWLLITIPGMGQSNTCKLLGSVTDLQKVGIPNAKVYFRTPKSQLAATGVSDVDGQFAVTLSKGTFRISVRSGVDMARYSRANIAVSCDDDPIINLYLLPECVSLGCNRPGFDFAIFRSSWTRSRDKDLVIAYNKRAKNGNKIVYKDAVLTFDFYTIYADQIVQNMSSRTFLVKGPGWIDDGKNRSDIASVAVSFTKKNIELKNRNEQ